MVGPYEILAQVGPNSYRLKLPESMKVHNVFHTSLLRLAASNPLLGQRASEPPLVIIDGNDEWEVDDILDSRLYYRRLQYKVK